MYRLVRTDELKLEFEPELKEVMSKIAELLRSGSVNRAVPVRNGEVVGEEILYTSLKLLGTRYTPVIDGDSGENIKPPISLEALGLYDESVGDPVRVFNDTLELLYRNWPTPVVKLKSLSNSRVRVWAKLEGYNPFSNSIKDRIGWSMIMEALRRGSLADKVYEATSTNTGIALASISNILGVKARLYVPQSIQKVTDIYLKVLGAEVVRMPVSLTVETIEDVDREAKASRATHLNQFENDANFKVHLRYTAKELDYQLRSSHIKPRAIVGGIGTSGHMSAVSFYFKNRYGDVKIYGAQPAPNEVIPGIRRVETGMKWIHWVEFDGIIDVKRDEAIEEAIRVARRDGIMIGLSSGAVVRAFKEIVDDEGDYVLIFPDTGYKYFEQFGEFLGKS